jgi:hypothetical protein
MESSAMNTFKTSGRTSLAGAALKKLMIGLLAAASLGPVSVMASGRHMSIEVTNLTNAIYFTPLLVSAHDADSHMFQAGTAASASLQYMAEGGDISFLATDLAALGANNVVNPAGGLLAPGTSASATLMAGGHNRYLSLVAMLLPTNDGFVGLDAIRIPKKRGTYTYYLNGYDAGTEANDEIINGGGMPGTPGIPADPGMNGGTGGSGVTVTEHNATVHVHRGIVGDTDPMGGTSDLNSVVHQWINPVAKVVVTIGRHN